MNFSHITGKFHATVGGVTVSRQLRKSIWSKSFPACFWLLLNKSLSLSRQAFCFMPALISSPVVSPLINWISLHSLNLQVFNNLIELVTSCGNYSQYRKRFSECAGFRFPILGVHLKDLIAVHVALPDWADKEKTRVNLTKTQQLYAILRELAQIQNTPPSIDANPDLLNLLTVSAKTGMCMCGVKECPRMIGLSWRCALNKQLTPGGIRSRTRCREFIHHEVQQNLKGAH